MEEVKKQGMESLFVPYEIALALKELGFDEPCFGHWNYNNGEINYWYDEEIQNERTNKWFLNLEEQFPKMNKNGCAAPTHSQAFHFFREKYGLMHIINPYDFTAEINYLNKRVVNDVYGDFIPHDHLVDDEGEEIKHLSYEDAEQACLLELINICKKK